MCIYNHAVVSVNPILNHGQGTSIMDSLFYDDTDRYIRHLLLGLMATQKGMKEESFLNEHDFFGIVWTMNR